MERTKETLKELIRAGRAKVPAHKVIKGGQVARQTAIFAARNEDAVIMSPA